MFTRTLEFYLEALKYESKTVMGGLEEEIALLKEEMEKLRQQRLERIKSVSDCAQDFTKGLMEQPLKMIERISLSQEDFFFMKETQALVAAIATMRRTSCYGYNGVEIDFVWPSANDLLQMPKN